MCNSSLQKRLLRPEHCDPLYLLQQLGLGQEYCALLESADRNHGVNDLSFLALGAREVIVSDNNTDPLQPLELLVGSGEANDFLTMGYIGFLSYESVRHFEDINLTPAENTPDAVFVLPEVILRIDHAKKEVLIIAHEDTNEDLNAIEQVVLASPYLNDERELIEKRSLDLPLPSLEDIAAYRCVSREEHCERVQKIQEGIQAGETFQVVLSQLLEIEQDVPAHAVYEALRVINPSPYMYYFQTPERTIVGASPETLLRVNGKEMLYRPIAGTRKRTGDPVKDRAMQEELMADEKERAEHQMLVDLGRNDVGKVAEIGSVKVEDAFHAETYAHVFHIVSNVRGTLPESISSLDALRSVFPQGTVSGAPKVRAMEVIRDTEQSPRGIYSGGFGYVDLSGNLDFAIAIRTLVFEDGKIKLRAGGGIVADSVPELEDNECLHKARSCLAAVQLARTSLQS